MLDAMRILTFLCAPALALSVAALKPRPSAQSLSASRDVPSLTQSWQQYTMVVDFFRDGGLDGVAVAGFQTDLVKLTKPRAVFSSIVGRPRHQGVMVGMGQKDVYIRNEAREKSGDLEVKALAPRGVIEELSLLGDVLPYVYKKLEANGEENPLVSR
uniref:Uncharacterized protein n=1 Tax=Chromera velia CCMP2878 TaxID=1169474 RepID=A0A0G4HK70_9ALVE